MIIKEADQSEIDRLLSELMVHDFNQVCNVLILRCLNEPLSKVTLDCNVKHLFLIACQARSFDFLLNL